MLVTPPKYEKSQEIEHIFGIIMLVPPPPFTLSSHPSPSLSPLAARFPRREADLESLDIDTHLSAFKIH